jgi:tRNA pseudouridine38-40 synthase
MRNLKLTVSYDGTRFVGWQRQGEGKSIQGLLEAAFMELEGASCTVHGAGRTDAGVHAAGQVASVRVTFMHDVKKITRALNAQLPKEIRVIAVEDVGSEFHARFSAAKKTYRYLIFNGPIVGPFINRFVWHIREPLDKTAMAIAAQQLVGTHDFNVFKSTSNDPSTTIRTLLYSDISEAQATLTDAHVQKLLVYEVSGNGFLHHMVRAIVGTLVDVGLGRRQANSISELLNGLPRSAAGATAPSSGLLLFRVDY